MENAEINNMIKILGLSYKRKYASEDDLKTLRYGKLMVMADQVGNASRLCASLAHAHADWD